MSRRSTLVFAALAAGGATLLLAMTAGLTFVNDEWHWVLHRYDGGLRSVLENYNQQIVVAPVALYKAVLHTFGLDDRWPYIVAIVALQVACAAVVLAHVRARHDEVLAVAAVAPLLVLGSGWESVLWPAASLNFVAVTAALVAAWLALDRGGRAGPPLACAALTAGVLSGTAIVAFLLAVAVELAISGRRRLLWVPGVPALLFAAWYVAYGSSDPVTLDRLLDASRWATDVLTSAAGGLVGLDRTAGVVLVLAGAAGLARAIVMRGATPRAIGIMVAIAGFLALTAAARAETPTANVLRYLYPLAVLLVLLAAEIVPRRAAATTRVRWIAAAIAVFAVAGNVGHLRDGQMTLRGISERLRAELAALELHPAAAAPGYAPAGDMAPVTAGPYLRVARLTGTSAAYDLDELRTAPAAARTEADRVLRELALTTGAGSGSRGAAAAPSWSQHVRAAPANGCTRLEPAGAGAAAEFPVAAGRGLTLTAVDRPAGSVTVRRFGDAFSAPVAQVTGSVRVAVAGDRAPDPWTFRVELAAPATVCF